MEICEFTSEEKEELVQYGIARAGTIMASMCMVVLIGVLVQKPKESVIFWIFFCIIRRYAGGYHADTPIRCYCISILIIIGALIGMDYVSHEMCLPLHLICFGVIISFSPIETANRVLSKYERCKYRRKTRISASIVLVLHLLLLYVECYAVIVPIVVAHIVVVGLLCAGGIKNALMRRRYKTDETFWKDEI